MKYKVFIDGSVGTTGLEIRERLAARGDIDILNIEEEKRKDLDLRLRKLHEADISFLCLPDPAAKEIADATGTECRILDTSTAHRTDPEWVYGMPELAPGQRERIARATRVAVPGCHASGAILLLKPLLADGVLAADSPVSITSVTGYTGGGKAMIARYEDASRHEMKRGDDAETAAPADPLESPGQYGLSQQHKHLPEIMAMTGLTTAPAFLPIVGDFPRGMMVSMTLHSNMLGRKENLAALYREYYAGEALIQVFSEEEGKETFDGGFLYANRMAGRDGVEILLYGNEERPVLSARFDNLGKGASGAAIQNMNIMLGINEMEGLRA